MGDSQGGSRGNHGSFGSELRGWRTERRLSQKRMGDLMGRSPEFVSQLERGKKRPGQTTIHSIIMATLGRLPSGDLGRGPCCECGPHTGSPATVIDQDDDSVCSRCYYQLRITAVRQR